MMSLLATLVVLAQSNASTALVPDNGYEGVLPVWVLIIVGGGVAAAATMAFGAPSRRRR